MKLSKNILRRLIKEELSKSINEVPHNRPIDNAFDDADSLLYRAMVGYVEAFEEQGSINPEEIKNRIMGDLDIIFDQYEFEYSDSQANRADGTPNDDEEDIYADVSDY